MGHTFQGRCLLGSTAYFVILMEEERRTIWRGKECLSWVCSRERGGVIEQKCPAMSMPGFLVCWLESREEGLLGEHLS